MVRLGLSLLCLSACSAASGPVLLREARDGGAGAFDAGVEAGAGDDASAADAEAGPPIDIKRGRCRISDGSGFLDQFDGTSLNPEHWLVAHGNVGIAGERAAGGFLRENVAVRDGKLILSVRGDSYAGPLRGLDEDGSPRSDGAGTGAAIATRDLFMSASYQWEGKLSAPSGVELMLVAMRDDPADGLIALTAPGLSPQAEPSYAFASAHIEGPLAAAVTEQIALTTPLDDGAVHSLRFDWHAGPGPNTPRIDVWQDPDLRQTVAGNAPARAARAWLAAFVPDGSAADFETFEVEINTAFITPFGEELDLCSDGELTGTALETPR